MQCHALPNGARISDQDNINLKKRKKKKTFKSYSYCSKSAVFGLFPSVVAFFLVLHV
jgi:hypothetical protein